MTSKIFLPDLFDRQVLGVPDSGLSFVPRGLRFSVRATERPDRCPYCTMPFANTVRVFNSDLGFICSDCDVEYRADRFPLVNLECGAELACALRFSEKRVYYKKRTRGKVERQSYLWR